MRTFTLDELISYWGIVSSEVVGLFIPLPKNDSYGLLVNLMGFDEMKSGRILMHPLSDQRLAMQGYYSLFPFKQGQYYRFQVKLPNARQVLRNASDKIPLKIDREATIEAIENPYSSIVEKCFIRYNDPESNVVLASFIEEAGKGMYSSRRRVFFELLQNADDYPAGPAKTVRLKVEVLQEHILLTYNSLPFNQADVRSIASIAQSTKLHDQHKTGYKGIGFKAVFTECKEVIIRSGGFQFAFIEKAEAFKSLESLYLTGDVVWNDSPKSQQRFVNEYGSRAAYYLESKNIPWQLKPIWHERLPMELKQTESLNKNLDNVSIILKPGRTLTSEFARDLQGIFTDPRFLLFLRHTHRLELLDHERLRLTIERTPTYEGHTREGHLATLYHNGSISYRYMVEKVRISVSEEQFKSMGLDLRFGVQRKGDEEIRIFTNTLGEKITGLPEKIASFDEITIQFAARMDNDQPVAEPSFTQTAPKSFIYTYLPMSENRIRLPFLVSADFIPSSNREEIQSETTWNHFIFYQIGYHCVKWVAYLAYTRQGNKFLDLLLPSFLNSGISSIRPVEVWFNKGFYQALSETPLVPNRTAGSEGALLMLDQVVVNKSPILDLFNESFFYSFAGEEFAQRQLPAFGLSIKVLENQLYTDEFGVKIFTDQHLILQLAHPVRRKLVEEQIRFANAGTYLALLNCLDRLAQEQPGAIRGISNELKLIRFGNELLSWHELQTDTRRIVRSKRTQGIDDLLTRLGIYVSDVDISQFSFLFDLLDIEHTYLSDNPKLFSFISAHTLNNSLEPIEKIRLFDFFVDENFKGVGEVSYTEKLSLFQTHGGSILPLSKMLVNKIFGLPRWLYSYVIAKQDQVVLGGYTAYLINEKTIFTRIFCETEFIQSITARLQADELGDFADALIYYKDKSGIEVSDYPERWFQMAWLYTGAETGYKSANDVYYSHALDVADASGIIESLTGWLLPYPKSREIIKQFELARFTKPINLTTASIRKNVILSREDAWLLLDFLTASSEGDFFKKWRFMTSESRLTLVPSSGMISYTAGDSLHDFIQNHYKGSSLVSIPEALADYPGLGKLGVLKGLALIEWLIAKKAILALVPFVAKYQNSKLSESLIDKLSILPFDSTRIYDSEAPECILIRSIRNIYRVKDVDEDKTSRDVFITKLRDKVLLDSIRPESQFYLERVTLKIGEKEKVTFSLSELLPNYANSTSLIDRLEKGLTGLDKEDKRFLRDNLFKSTPKKMTDIIKELRALQEPYLSPLRTVFLLMCEEAEPDHFKNLLQPFKNKVFDDYFYNKQDTNRLHASYREFLTYCHHFHFVCDKFKFYDLDLKGLVDAPEAVAVELVPEWLEEWADVEEGRRTLLYEWGVNGPDSNVVNLRKALSEGDLSISDELVMELRGQKKLLLKTMQWLYENKTPLDKSITSIYGILSQIANEPEGTKFLPVLLPERGNRLVYELIEYDTQFLHLFHAEWGEYIADVFDYIKSQNGYLIEPEMPVSIREKLNFVNNIEIATSLPPELESVCRPLSDKIYTNWEKHSEYPIYEYGSHELPWKAWYNGVSIGNGGRRDKVYFDSRTKLTFLTSDVASDFPNCLMGVFPDQECIELLKLKHSSEMEATSLPDQPKKFYTPQFQRIIGGDELNDERQGREFKESILRGIPYLEEQGFDFTQCDASLGLHFLNVSRVGFDVLYNVTFRAAKGGLLYLNFGAWKRLGINNEVLVVVFEEGEMRLFESKEEMLGQPWNDYMLYRTEKPIKLDENYSGITLDDKTTHLLFVTNQGMYQSLYHEKLSQKINKSVPASSAEPDEL